MRVSEWWFLDIYIRNCLCNIFITTFWDLVIWLLLHALHLAHCSFTFLGKWVQLWIILCELIHLPQRTGLVNEFSYLDQFQVTGTPIIVSSMYYVEIWYFHFRILCLYNYVCVFVLFQCLALNKISWSSFSLN